MFWNNGAETIDRQDITKTNPLTIISTKGAKLLDSKVLASNNEASQFRCVLQDDNHALIDFDYLDKGHGVIIQVVHTGVSSKSVTIGGQIKGVHAITLREFILEDMTPFILSSSNGKPKISLTMRRRIFFMFWFFGGLLLAFLGGTVLTVLVQNGGNLPAPQASSPPPPSIPDPLIFFVFGPVFLLMGLIFIFMS